MPATVTHAITFTIGAVLGTCAGLALARLAQLEQQLMDSIMDAQTREDTDEE